MTSRTQPFLAFMLALAASAAAIPAEVRAQERGANPVAFKHRNDCRLAAQVLITGEPRTRREWARGYIANCENEGPLAIIQEWRNVPSDTAAVVQLMRASTAIRDMRIYEQVRSVAVDRSRADVVRVGAMHVLDSYVDPHHAGWFMNRAPADGQVRRVYPANAYAMHAPFTNGPVPVVGSVRVPVLELLQQVAAARQVEPITVWYAAAALAKRLDYQVKR